AQPGPPPPPQVTVASVIERDVTEWDEFTGRLQAVDSVEVRPRVSGLIAAVRFQEGAIVRRGDPLFEIDPRPFQAEVDRLRAELNRAKATNQRATSELQTAERLRTENAIAKEEHDRRAAFAQESAAQSSPRATLCRVARARPRCSRRSSRSIRSTPTSTLTSRSSSSTTRPARARAAGTERSCRFAWRWQMTTASRA